MRPNEIFINFFDKKSTILLWWQTHASELPDMVPFHLGIFRLNVLLECYMTLSDFLCMVVEYWCTAVYKTFVDTLSDGIFLYLNYKISG